MTVPDTKELKWWILGHGDGIVVQKPMTLRNEIMMIILHMTDHYGKNKRSVKGIKSL